MVAHGVSILALFLAAIISTNPHLTLVWLGSIGVLWGVFDWEASR